MMVRGTREMAREVCLWEWDVRSMDTAGSCDRGWDWTQWWGQGRGSALVRGGAQAAGNCPSQQRWGQSLTSRIGCMGHNCTDDWPLTSRGPRRLWSLVTHSTGASWLWGNWSLAATAWHLVTKQRSLGPFPYFHSLRCSKSEINNYQL